MTYKQVDLEIIHRQVIHSVSFIFFRKYVVYENGDDFVKFLRYNEQVKLNSNITISFDKINVKCNSIYIPILPGKVFASISLDLFESIEHCEHEKFKYVSIEDDSNMLKSGVKIIGITLLSVVCVVIAATISIPVLTISGIVHLSSIGYNLIKDYVNDYHV